MNQFCSPFTNSFFGQCPPQSPTQCPPSPFWNGSNCFNPGTSWNTPFSNWCGQPFNSGNCGWGSPSAQPSYFNGSNGFTSPNGFCNTNSFGGQMPNGCMGSACPDFTGNGCCMTMNNNTFVWTPMGPVPVNFAPSTGSSWGNTMPFSNPTYSNWSNPQTSCPWIAQTCAQICSQICSQICTPICNQICTQVWNQLCAQSGSQTWNQSWNQSCSPSFGTNPCAISPYGGFGPTSSASWCGTPFMGSAFGGNTFGGMPFTSSSFGTSPFGSQGYSHGYTHGMNGVPSAFINTNKPFPGMPIQTCPPVPAQGINLGNNTNGACTPTPYGADNMCCQPLGRNAA